MMVLERMNLKKVQVKEWRENEWRKTWMLWEIPTWRTRNQMYLHILGILAVETSTEHCDPSAVNTKQWTWQNQSRLGKKTKDRSHYSRRMAMRRARCRGIRRKQHQSQLAEGGESLGDIVGNQSQMYPLL